MKPWKAIIIGLIPYALIAFGLYVLSNALVAVGLYFATMFIFIILLKDDKIFTMIFSGWKWREGLIFSLITDFHRNNYTYYYF